MNQGNSEGQKFALLIGVSECASGFKPLRCPSKGVAAIHEILTNPDIGGFSSDRVRSLVNPSVSEMQSAIGELFSRCTYRDFVLLYFTGHGITDEQGNLFFTTRETLKFENGSLNRGTAVAASFVRNEMQNCQSRRQVAILDCCFSGAFPDGVLAMDDQTINLEQQLGGEGRAILTAATSTQYALEQSGEELSVYTRYLVKGLGGGEAVPTDQELIRVGDLANYIREQLETAAPAMSPQIYAARQGLNIILARVLVNNELRYQQLAQEYLEHDGTFSDTGQYILNACAEEWRLSPEKACEIVQKITQPYRERQANLKKYAAALQVAVNNYRPHPLSKKTWKQLLDYQQILNLRDEDVVPILSDYSLSMPTHATHEGAIFSQESSVIPNENKTVDESSASQYNGEVEPSNGNTSPNTSTNKRNGFSLERYSEGLTSSVLLKPLLAIAGITGIYFLIISTISGNRYLSDSLGTSSSPALVGSPALSPGLTLEAVQNLISIGDNANLYGSRSNSRQFRGLVQYKSQLMDGISHFKARDYVSSLSTFKGILNDTGNEPSSPRKDPEILIFRNNSQARLNYQNEGKPVYTIAAAVPLSDADGEPFNIGQQILFGIAQAQTQALEDGINLEVVIANDRNVPEQATKLAEELIKPTITGSDNIEREILAVIGHYSSTVTCAALTFYNQAGLAVISPASTQRDLRSNSDCNEGQDEGPVFFRTTSSSKIEAQTLVDYLVNRSGINNPKVAVFYRKGEGFSQDLTDAFAEILGNRAQVSLFDLSNSTEFNRGNNQLDDFDALAIFPDGRTSDATAFDRAIGLLTNSRNQLILGANPLYDAPNLVDRDRLPQLRVQRDNPSKGLVVAIDWFPGCGSNADFVRTASSIWGGDPNRIYAMSYEAVQVIVDRLDQDNINTRASMLRALGNSQNTVRSSVFQDKTISFDQNGDRKEIQSRILLTPRSAEGFEPVEGYCSL